MENKNTIRNKLLAAKEAYYSGTPKMTDEEFDNLEDKLKQVSPNDKYFLAVGNPTATTEKVTHLFPMLSMSKAKSSDDVLAWGKKIAIDKKERVCTEPKIDGQSVELEYFDGGLERVSSRGDGKTGQDLTHIGKHISDIKMTIPLLGRVYIRGELHLPKINPIATEKLRNTCSGILNRKEDDCKDLKHIRCVVYEVYGDCNYETISETLDNMSDWGFYTVPYGLMALSEIEKTFVDYTENKRAEWEFETDGLVISVNNKTSHKEIDSRWVVDHHHHYNIALKPPSKSEWTILEDIEWNISKNGYLIPVAIMKPVTIDGITIERATLNNAQMVVDLVLAVGDDIELKRANDVIPYVNNVHHNNSPAIVIPKVCHACGKVTEWYGVHIRCTNEDCPDRKIQLITAWCKKSDMLGISEQGVRKMWNDLGIRSIADLYRLTPERLLAVQGWKERMGMKVYKIIQSHKTMKAIDILSMLAIPLVGKKVLEKLKLSTIEDFISFDDSTTKIGQNIITWRNQLNNLQMLFEIVEVITIKEKQEEEVIVKENAVNIAMTGSGPIPRKEVVALIKERGDIFNSSITKDTDVLLCADPNTGSTKLKKAEERGVKIVAYSTYLK